MSRGVKSVDIGGRSSVLFHEPEKFHAEIVTEAQQSEEMHHRVEIQSNLRKGYNHYFLLLLYVN